MEEVEKAIGEVAVVVVNVIERKSEGYYNYKTRWVAVYVPPRSAPYEEQDIITVKEVRIYCGTYQEIKYCSDIVERLSEMGFTVIER